MQWTELSAYIIPIATFDLCYRFLLPQAGEKYFNFYATSVDIEV